jgi:hypothetical protein
MELDPRPEPLPRAVSNQRFPVEALNPLLRGLLGWGLVERVEYADGTHHWELSEAAQRRLDDLTPERRRAVTTLAYLDHWCSNCREQRLTHLVDGRYLCVECQQLGQEDHDQQASGRRTEKPWQRRLRHGH